MKKTRRLVFVTVMIITMLASSVPAFAFGFNESRSVQNFFIESQMLKGSGNSYGLDKTPTRMEGIVILIRLLGKEAEAQEMKSLPCQFTDVPDWAKGYANYAYAQNISKGVSDTLFGTTNPMNAKQVNTLLLRAIGYDDTQGDFTWNRSVDKAAELQILPQDMADQYSFNQSYTKKDLIETSFCYLDADLKGQDQTLIGSLIANNVVSDELAEKYGLDIPGWDTIRTDFNPNDYLNFTIDDEELNITGTSQDPNHKWLIAQIKSIETGAKKLDTDGRISSDGEYNLRLSLASLPKGEYYVDVYGNDEKYHYYTSIVLSSIIMKKTEDGAYFTAAPVYGANLRIFNGNELNNLDYQMTTPTSSRQEAVDAITSLAQQITEGVNGDYEKAQAVHDWVAENIYYDNDYLNGKTKKTNIKSIDVMNNKYAVCSGYSNLTNDLLAALKIPSRQVLGYSLGVTGEENWSQVNFNSLKENHVWNEAYIDGKWIIMDVTWDSSNTYEGGKFEKGDGVGQQFFDASVPFFANTHKTMEQ